MSVIEVWLVRLSRPQGDVLLICSCQGDHHLEVEEIPLLDSEQVSWELTGRLYLFAYLVVMPVATPPRLATRLHLHLPRVPSGRESQELASLEQEFQQALGYRGWQVTIEEYDQVPDLLLEKLSVRS